MRPIIVGGLVGGFAALGIVLAIPGDQPILGYVLGVVFTLAGAWSGWWLTEPRP